MHAQARGQALPPLPAGQTNDPFPAPIRATEGAVRVNVTEFASLPEIGGVAARMMNLDINAQTWGHPVQSAGRERGFQSFAFHPQFGQAGTPGFGKFYTYVDTSNMTPTPDFLPSGGSNTHDTIVLEWTATTPSATTYDGGPPRELFRLRQPFQNHNAGHMAFNPDVAPGHSEFGLLYIAVADGGSGGDPFRHAQNMGSAFGANLGWNAWEGSYRFVSTQGVAVDNPRSDPTMTYPVVEWGQPDPLLQPQSAADGVLVYRGSIPSIANLVLFTDMPSGEIFFFNADAIPNGGQDPIRRVILRSDDADKTLLQLIQEKNTAQGKTPATRADLRLSMGPDNQVLLLNKGDGTIRQLVP